MKETKNAGCLLKNTKIQSEFIGLWKYKDEIMNICPLGMEKHTQQLDNLANIQLSRSMQKRGEKLCQ